MALPTPRTLKKYGLTLDKYLQLYQDTDGGRCPLCKRRFTKNRLACIDHNHRTFQVRGIICSQCNNKIGELHDNADWLQAAADYLRNPPAERIFTKAPRVQNAPPEELWDSQ